MDSRFLVSVLILFALAWNECSSVNGHRQDQQQRPAARKLEQQGNPRHGRAGPRIKRMFAICPPNFERLGNECYYFSTEKANWLDAQFQCLDRNSKLAEPGTKVNDRRLRKHLLGMSSSSNVDKIAEMWLGGKYDWAQFNWQWGYNGRKMKYQAFARPKDKARDANLQHHCTVMRRDIKYRWAAVPCMEEHYFVCQHRMPVVKKDNLQHIYQMWNNTFPNQIANEIEVIFTNRDTGDLRQRFQVEASDPRQRMVQQQQQRRRERQRTKAMRDGNAPRNQINRINSIDDQSEKAMGKDIGQMRQLKRDERARVAEERHRAKQERKDEMRTAQVGKKMNHEKRRIEKFEEKYF